MKVYLYEFETKEFLGEQVLTYRDPVRDELIIPTNSTTIEPPAPRANVTYLFKDDAWVATADHRGKKSYNTETSEEVEVDYLGELREGFTLLRPEGNVVWENGRWVEQEAVEQEKTIPEKINEIDEETREEFNEGFAYNGNLFSLSLEAQINILTAKTANQDYRVSTTDNQEVVIPRNEVETFFNAYMTKKNEILARGRLKRTKLGATS